MTNFKFENMNDKKYRTYYEQKKDNLLFAKYIDINVIDDYYRCSYALNIPSNLYNNYRYNKNDLQRIALIDTVKTFMNRDNISSEFYSDNKIEQAKYIVLFLQKSFNIKGNQYNNIRLNIPEDDYVLKDKYGNKLNINELFEYDHYSFEDARTLFLNNKTNENLNYLIRKFYDIYQTYTFSNFDTYSFKFNFSDTEDINYYCHLDKLKKHQLIINENGKQRKIGVNRLPIDFHCQEDITFKFKTDNIDIELNDVFVYNDFVFEIFCKKKGEQEYKKISSYYDHNKNVYCLHKCNKFLILVNTKRGAYIYESDFGEFVIDNYIIEKGFLNKDIIYLKNKEDYFDKYISIINKNYMLSHYYIGDFAKKVFLKSSFATTDNDEMFNDYYITDIYSQKGLDLKNIALQIAETEIMPNLFDDDNSLNYHFRVRKDDIKLNSLLNSFLADGDVDNAFFKNSSMYCGTIYHIPINKIFDCITTNNIDKLIDNYAKKDTDLKKYLYNLKDVCNTIATKISIKMNINVDDVPIFLYEKYLKKFEVSKIRKNHNEVLKNNPINWNVSSENNVEENYLDEDLKKWKSEYSLYLLVSEQYPDTIYQFKDSWLNLQSLDIYIPSLKIGIEYQGIQHFKAIEYFGGEEGFNELQQRDKLKKELCKKNKIKLIEWLYTEPITEVLLTEKIKGIMEEDI